MPCLLILAFYKPRTTSVFSKYCFEQTNHLEPKHIPEAVCLRLFGLCFLFQAQLCILME